MQSKPTLPEKLSDFEKKVSSQFGEDGVLKALVNVLHPMPYFVEFGVGPPWRGTLEENGLEGNCVQLRDALGWQGLFMDGSEYPKSYGVEQEFIAPLNINGLLNKYSVPKNFGVISIDVDGQDIWIWMNLRARPDIVVIEYNSNFEIDESFCVQFDENFVWDTTKYYGASLAALEKVGRSKGYVMVHTTEANAFFVRHDRISNSAAFCLEKCFRRMEVHKPDSLSRKWVTV